MRKIDNLRFADTKNIHNYDLYGIKRHPSYYIKKNSHWLIKDAILGVVFFSIAFYLIALMLNKNLNIFSLTLYSTSIFITAGFILDIIRTPKYEKIYGVTNESIIIIEPVDTQNHRKKILNYKTKKLFSKKGIEELSSIHNNKVRIVHKDCSAKIPYELLLKEELRSLAY